VSFVCLALVYVCALSHLLVLFCPRDIPVLVFLPLVNLTQIQWAACGQAVEAGGKIRTSPKVVGKNAQRQARPRATPLQSADPRVHTVVEKSGRFLCSAYPIQKPPAQSQRKISQIGATWRLQSTIRCSSCKRLVRLAYIRLCPGLCWVTQSIKGNKGSIHQMRSPRFKIQIFHR
jgi:hypothetical protein